MTGMTLSTVVVSFEWSTFRAQKCIEKSIFDAPIHILGHNDPDKLLYVVNEDANIKSETINAKQYISEYERFNI